MDRSTTIIRTSLVGVAVNVVLVVFKAIVGAVTGSIAVILDAVNNLGDALSSVITIVGTKLAGRRPDKKHPYGYGRIEYLTSVIIAVIILAAGFTSLRESIAKAMDPQPASYTAVSLAVLAVAVAAKLLVGRYVKSVGERIHAQSLVASGSDAFFDAVLSFATLAAAVISMVWGLSLEGILGVVISIVILKAGVEILLDTLNSIIGARADPELSKTLKTKINSVEGVLGCYDLTLHNYGPEELIGSVHIEVADDVTAREIHALTRQIAAEVYAAFGIVLTVGIYASNTSGDGLLEVRSALEELLRQYPQVLQMHGFYAEREQKRISFDLVVDFEADAKQTCADVTAAMKRKFPDYEFAVVLDSDYSD